jgi:hypothetical protein
LIAVVKSLGRTCRGEETVAAAWLLGGEDEGESAEGEEGSRPDAGEVGLGVVDRVLTVPMRWIKGGLESGSNGPNGFWPLLGFGF